MLTEHQSNRKDEVAQLVQKEQIILLKGSAGVGKTYLVNQLIKTIPNHGRKILCSAPTHKAVAVLEQKVDSASNVEFATIHSALKMKRKVNYKTGAVSFEPKYNKSYPPFKGFGILIVDEASMIGEAIKGFIEEHAKKQRLTVIFIGDSKQINPVKENDSAVFLGTPYVFGNKEEAISFSETCKYGHTIVNNSSISITVYKKYPEVELTEIIRQGAGNPIIDLSRDLKKTNSLEDNVIVSEEGSKLGYIFTEDKGSVVTTLAHINGTNDLKYLSWTNESANEINTLVRQEIYGTPAKIMQGESLLFNAPYKDDYKNNDEIKVKELVIKQKKFQFISNKLGVIEPGIGEEAYYGYIDLKYYCINPVIVDDEVINEGVLVIHEDSDETFKKFSAALHNKAKFGDIDWTTKFEFLEQFADINYNHAMTVHKSQGSTFKQVIVNVNDIKSNFNKVEVERLLYTAVTRASDLLILFIEPSKKRKGSW